MKIFTSKLGNIEINEDTIITFKDGLFGFEHLKRFAIYENKPGSLLKWLVPINEPNVSFIIIRPDQFHYNYTLKISDEDIKFLDIKSEEDVLVYAIVVVPSDPKKMTANLQGPLVINAVNRQGKQVISTNPKHVLKHYILDEMKQNAEKLKDAIKKEHTKNEEIFLNTPNSEKGGKI